MKTVSKKLLSLLLVAITLISVLPMQAFAAGNEISDKVSVSATSVKADGTLTLNANGGKISSAKTVTYDTVKGKKIGYKIDDLPTPTKSGYTFKGWFFEDDGSRVELGNKVTWKGDRVAKAKWSQTTYLLTVKRVLEGDNNTAQTIWEGKVAKNTPLLDFLKDNVAITVDKGYKWGNKYWYDYSGTQPLTSQADKMDQAQTVYVNFTPKTYTLYFNVDGGKVDPTSKDVKFNHKVGTLPTPTKKDQVFLGWFTEPNGNGKQYTASTVMKAANDVTLYAHFEKEAIVLLRIYLDGHTSSPDRIVEMDSYIKDENVTRKDVESIIKKYYSAASGTSLKLEGLYTDATWASYKKDTSKAGTPTVQIDRNHVNNVYVMVKNATQGGTNVVGSNNGSSSSSSSNGDSSNPKTGDSAYIYTAATVMVCAAAAFVTMEQLRKRKMI